MSQILVLEGDVCLRNVVREVLEDEGYTVIEANNDYEGLPHGPEAPGEPAQRNLQYFVAI